MRREIYAKDREIEALKRQISDMKGNILSCLFFKINIRMIPKSECIQIMFIISERP